MTTSDATPTDGPADEDPRAELARVEADRAELLGQVAELRAELSDEGTMDALDRAAILTQAEELESFAAELGRRRDALVKALDSSS